MSAHCFCNACPRNELNPGDLYHTCLKYSRHSLGHGQPTCCPDLRYHATKTHYHLANEIQWYTLRLRADPGNDDLIERCAKGTMFVFPELDERLKDFLIHWDKLRMIYCRSQ